MLSPVLLDELRAHWRRLRRKSGTWLFPGNRWHSGDQPIATKTPRHRLWPVAVESALGLARFSILYTDGRSYLPSIEDAHQHLPLQPAAFA
jgi:CelD/BcsL family acetyltransferase involved in cellulose biosynthesis